MADSPNITVRSAANLVCFQLEVHIWTGRRKLDKTDLIRADPNFAKLPEKDLATLGAIKICDPDVIKAFQRLKNQAETILERAGLPILGAWGVPEDKFQEVYKGLTELKQKFEKLLADFARDYDVYMDTWKEAHLRKHPEWRHMFDNLPSANEAVAGLAFKFHPYRIAAPSGNDPQFNTAFDEEMGGLRGSLLKGVYEEADKFLVSLAQERAGAVTQRTYITPKTVGPLRRISDKLGAFLFVDPSLAPVASYLRGLLDKLPNDGQITGDHLIALRTLADKLRDPESVKRLCSEASGGAQLVQIPDVEAGNPLPQGVDFMSDMLDPFTDPPLETPPVESSQPQAQPDEATFI